MGKIEIIRKIKKIKKYIVKIWSYQKLYHDFKLLVECEKRLILWIWYWVFSLGYPKVMGGIYSRNVDGNYNNSSLNSFVVNNKSSWQFKHCLSFQLLESTYIQSMKGVIMCARNKNIINFGKVKVKRKEFRSLLAKGDVKWKKG